ncbi:unnamed protein product [Heterosigma akashiwo]
MYFLEDEDLARQLVELGYRGSGDTLQREEFGKKRRCGRGPRRRARRPSGWPARARTWPRSLSCTRWPRGRSWCATGSWRRSSSSATATPRARRCPGTSTTRTACAPSRPSGPTSSGASGCSRGRRTSATTTGRRRPPPPTLPPTSRSSLTTKLACFSRTKEIGKSLMLIQRWVRRVITQADMKFLQQSIFKL